MTLFEGEQNGRYETDHLHMVLDEHIDFTEEGLSDDRKYSIFVHEYVHYYQHFATLYGSQFCKMANLLFIETRAFLEGADKVVMPFGIWEHNEGISRYRNRVKAVCGSKSCSHIVGDVEIDRREIRIAEEEKKAVKIGVYDYTEDEAYEDGFNFGYYCIIESMAHLIQKWKALSPILVTEEGMFMEVRERQSRKASLSIPETRYPLTYSCISAVELFLSARPTTTAFCSCSFTSYLTPFTTTSLAHEGRAHSIPTITKRQWRTSA